MARERDEWTNAAFESSWEDHAYEFRGGDYDVVCIQVVLVRKMDSVQDMALFFYLRFSVIMT